jgi:hypothetical protein
MDTKFDSRRCLDADQTKAVLATMYGLSDKLRDFENVKLDSDESCRALLANFIYAWTVAEASGLAVVTELAEMGIVEMSVRLGFKVKKERQTLQWHSNAKKLI